MKSLEVLFCDFWIEPCYLDLFSVQNLGQILKFPCRLFLLDYTIESGSSFASRRPIRWLQSKEFMKEKLLNFDILLPDFRDMIEFLKALWDLHIK